MSSLLQHRYKITDEGVHLLCYHVLKIPYTGSSGKVYGFLTEQPVDLYPCGHCGRKHPRLWTFIRKPAGMLGCWVQFRINGDIAVPDLSVPMGLEQIPVRSKKLSIEECTEIWHSP